MRLSLLIVLLCLIIFGKAQQINIIPQPVSVVKKDGSFTLTTKTSIVSDNAGTKNAAIYFNKYLKSYYGIELPVVQKAANGIILTIDKNITPKDGYVLDANTKEINIRANTAAGIFYGIQTLIQLLPVEKDATLNIPSVLVKDSPAMSYRGMHLDVGRHFFPVEYVKKYIDYIALHKMNYFHWHLTEDQGWRVEIKKYPKLITTGAWRNGTIIGHHPGKGNDEKKHGGFYTQKEIKEVVEYAAKRYITVVPEIEMPGHASAAIAAYPFLSCFPDKATEISSNTPWFGPRDGKQVQQTWGVFDDVFCAGKESTFSFIEDVLEEVLPLFPSKYVHVGGDECPKVHWKQCPACQQRMKSLGLQDEHALQSYFIQRIEKYLNKKGKILIGWDEILEGGLAPNAVVMSWRGEEGGITAAKQKHDVIMTPGEYAYFDHSQTKNEDSVVIGGYLPIERVYNWNIVPKSLAVEEQKYILGGQANLWTEYIKNPSKLEYMAFPRAAALSEALWTPVKNRNWEEFQKRLKVQKLRYDMWGINYYKK